MSDIARLKRNEATAHRLGLFGLEYSYQRERRELECELMEQQPGYVECPSCHGAGEVERAYRFGFDCCRQCEGEGQVQL